MYGPRFDRKGEVISRSIVGEKGAFERMRSLHLSRSKLSKESEYGKFNTQSHQPINLKRK